jgi:uncharacterized protein (UPF0276 family)
MKNHILQGAGLALRPALLAPLKKGAPNNLQFLELTPPDWIGIGGRVGADLKQLTQHYPSVCLSQSLSLGGPSQLDKEVLTDLQMFIAEHDIQVFSEALAWSADDAPLFINLPIPSTRAAVVWTVDRIAQVQDALGLRIGIRNVAHRMAPPQIEMNEACVLVSIHMHFCERCHWPASTTCVWAMSTPCWAKCWRARIVVWRAAYRM